MNWENLFSSKRLKESSNSNKNISTRRSAFQADFDRIIFSDSFRKLQNKTQVFPLPGPIFVHNRLTHSLEVASVGRSLGALIGDLLVQRYNWNEDSEVYHFYNLELGNVISAACLAHDIGNPPFGHSGEDAIRSFFLNEDNKLVLKIKSLFDAEEWFDFTRFEGNSMAFKVLTYQKRDENSVFNLTYTTLASLLKYPCIAKYGFDKTKKNVATKKSGFFTSDYTKAKQIFNFLHIPTLSQNDKSFARHPFVFITEAADDICYRIIDLEDAYRLQIIDFNTYKDLILPFFKIWNDEEQYRSLEIKINSYQDESHAVSLLRSIWINEMTQRCAQFFIENEEKLLEATMNRSLIDGLKSEEVALLKEIDRFSYAKIYNYSSALGIEIGGYEIISTLLHDILNATLFIEASKSKKILSFLNLDKQYFFDMNDKEKVHFVLMTIVGFTDNYALDLYRKLKGDFSGKL